MNVLFVLLFVWSLAGARELCEVCFCGRQKYNNKMMDVANCTARRLTSSNITVFLETLPAVEVLILNNNDLPLLPINLFGEEKNCSNLQVIEMSNNKIEEVKGKAFHHVPNVELLILDHNSISLEKNIHPRMFSNLENLRELHLTDAFLDHESPEFASRLHDVFINSSMTKLEKLHLEQNEIINFTDVNVFCDLKNLLDLHLGDNILTGVNFRIDCLPSLRFLDLEGNEIHAFTDNELAKFDALPAKNQSLMIDIQDNPFICDCKMNLFPWLRTTKVVVRHNSSIRCHFSHNDTDLLLNDFIASMCASDFSPADYAAHNFANFSIILIFCCLIVLLFYISARYSLDYFKQSSVSSSKVHYVVIKNYDENREVHV